MIGRTPNSSYSSPCDWRGGLLLGMGPLLMKLHLCVRERREGGPKHHRETVWVHLVF